MTKRRYTVEEISEMKTQIFEDNIAERTKFQKIAQWVSEKGNIKTTTCDFSDYAGSESNPHIPYYYIVVYVRDYAKPSPWLIERVLGQESCKPPVAGIDTTHKGFMLEADIPDVGKIKTYVSVVEDYD